MSRATTCLSVSVVTFHPDIPMLRATLESLRQAVEFAQQEGVLGETELVLVDNGSDAGLQAVALASGWNSARVISGQGNVGFGCGHNLAMLPSRGDLHLILNPDVDIEVPALNLALDFMAKHPECAMLSPAIVEGAGDWHFLCKRYPSILDLFLRGFVPAAIRRRFARRLGRYEMADAGQPDVLWDPPIASGCFMLCRTDVLAQLKGFDPRYFLYFEDFDLSLRAASCGRVAAVASVRIAHYGGGAGRKGWRHIMMFGQSAWRFFAKHGWRFC
jgi:GT2 family glycosyltransferase